MRRTLFDPEHDALRAAFRTFVDREAVPHVERWEAQGTIDRDFIRKAAAAGYLGFEVDIDHGGMGVKDFRYNTVIDEEVVDSGMVGDVFSMQNDIALPYLRDLTNEEQRSRWLPSFVSGDCVTALAMTEPSAGSDLARILTTARRDGDWLVVNGSKTLITSGATCDLAVVLVKTGERDGRGTSLVAVEAGTPGFERGRPLVKIGRKAQDTAELYFTECRVPMANLIGDPGRGRTHAATNLARERLSIAVSACASARRALRLAVGHTGSRQAFGGPLSQLQSVRMSLAEMYSETAVVQEFVDRCVTALNDNELTAVDAATAKYKATELEWFVVDHTLQLFGGYGYMEEYPIARIWRDARVQRIYGGANEVMKDIIGRGVCQG